MMSGRSKVMVAGHICLDITPAFNPDRQGNFADILSPGKLINVGKAVLSTGGAVTNTGLTMDRLGVEVFLNGKVGEDEIGGLIKELVGSSHAPSFKAVSNQASSYSIVLALPGVDRVFLHNPGTNDTFGADDIDYAVLKDCSLFHFGYPTLMKKLYENQGYELVKMFEKVKKNDVITSLDMTLPDPNSDSGRVDWVKILKQLLPYVDIFLPSIEEIAFMLEPDLFETRKVQAGDKDPVLFYTASDCSMLSEKIIDMGVAVAAIKKGIHGYYLRTADKRRFFLISNIIKCDSDIWSSRELWAGSYKADKFGSATGAGDTTIAGFLTAFLKGLTPIEAIKAANMLGCQNVQEVDALSGIKDWSSTMDMIRCDKPLNPLFICNPDWHFHESEKVYYGPNDKENN